MIAVIQRVLSASVSIEKQTKSAINRGLLVLVGIEEMDDRADIEWLVKKTVNLRIFSDKDGKMNLSLLDTKGEALIVSQFTLHSSTKKGNRPSYTKAAKPKVAVPLYERFVETFKKAISTEVKTGKFGAEMQVELINDGPVTILIDTKNKR